jgi:L,D-peptidoglycan transpeptidase YkuD (ErfK/YbiS/YcfS/YnhG family)
MMLLFPLFTALSLAEAVDKINVIATGGHACELHYLDRVFRCSLGENGVTNNKKEGDRCTPVGEFLLRRAFYRADRIDPAPKTLLNLAATQPDFAWCDDPSSKKYNQFVTLPFSPSHEDLFFNNTYYDLMAVIGYNDAAPIPGECTTVACI